MLTVCYYCLGCQIELARIKTIEDENLRLTQEIEKSKRGNNVLTTFNLNEIMCPHLLSNNYITYRTNNHSLKINGCRLQCKKGQYNYIHNVL